jgi:hypothetical protein
METKEHIKVLERLKQERGLPQYCNHGIGTWKPNAETIALSLAIETLQQLESGELVKLPCWGKVFIRSNGKVQEMEMCHYRGNTAGIYDMRCECTNQHEDCDSLCGNMGGEACAYNFRIAEIGKTVFLTREAAEAMKGESHEH